MTVMLDQLPPPAQSAVYPGRVAPSDVVGLIVGPNTLGEYLTAVSATGDDTTTRIRFGYGAYVQLEERPSPFGHLVRGNPHRPWKATRR